MATQPTSLFEQFLTYLATQQLLDPDQQTLIATSGGVDSVVLAHLFYRARLPFAIAHCHFGLRDKEADVAKQLVTSLANDYSVACYNKRFDTKAYAQAHKVSIQMAARTLRYQWFATLCQAHGLAKVATAHHLDDQVETCLLHLTKGTSLFGLQGIGAHTAQVIRPLLFATKQDLIHYAHAHRLTWCEDSSNQQTKYQRNRIRHQVIPQLKEINPDLTGTLQRTTKQLGQLFSFFATQAEAIKKQVWETRLPYHHIAVGSLLKDRWASMLLYYWLQPYGFHFDQLQRWCDQPPQAGKRLYASKHVLWADRDVWVLAPLAVERGLGERLDSFNYQLTATTRKQDTAYGSLRITCTAYSDYTSSQQGDVASLDFGKLTFPLQLRLWQAGDTFQPLGMRGHKKVSDLLIDSKVALLDKKRTIVLVSASQVAWVVGHRIDERFKLTPTTQQVYQLTWQENPRYDARVAETFTVSSDTHRIS